MNEKQYWFHVTTEAETFHHLDIYEANDLAVATKQDGLPFRLLACVMGKGTTVVHDSLTGGVEDEKCLR